MVALMSLLSCEHASRGEDKVDASSCLDSAATVDLLGGKHCEQASNVQDMDSPQALGTAGEDVEVVQVGDCEVHEGMKLQGACMAPWMDKTLISLGNRVKEGYTMIAGGTEAYLISPANDLCITK